MAASEYGKWIKVGNDLGLGGDELKMFDKERQEEAKPEKAKAEEAEREARKMELEGKRLLAEAKKLEFEEKKQVAERKAESRRIAAEQETKKLEFEEKKQIAEREAESKRIAAEQEIKKLEFEAKRQEMESHERIRSKEMEVRLAQEQGNAERQNIIGQGDSRSDYRGNIRDIQMPTYDQSEDLHCYLNRVELTCNTLKISKDLWVLALIKSVKGQALEVHERMKAEDAQDYEKLKVELLKRFRLTEGGYRKKFKGAVREKDETAMQFGERIAGYLDKWLQMAGFEENYAGLRALIVRDQFFVKCDDETRCFIKQKGKLDLEDTLTQAQYFIESKEEMEREWIPSRKEEKNSFQDFQKEKNRNHMTKQKERPSESKDTRSFQPKSGFSNHWHLKNQNSDGNKEQMKQRCFICKSNEHKAYECPKRYGEHSAYKNAMIQCENEKKSKDDEGEEEFEMYALAVSESNARAEKKDEDYADFIDKFKVNGRVVEALYDTGATKAALKRDLVRPDQYTDKWVRCRFANGTSARYPIAKVEIDGELFKGMVEVMVIPDLLKEMVVTPKQYVRPMKAKKVLTQNSSTNTIIEEELENVQAEDAHKYERSKIKEEIRDDDEEIKRGECLHGLTLQEEIPNTYRKAQGQLGKSQLKDGKGYTQKKRLSQVDVGDFVKVLSTLKASKTQKKWLGPFEGIDKIGVLDYRVKLDDGSIKTYHVNMVKKDVNRRKEDIAVVKNHELAAVATVVVDDDKFREEFKRTKRNDGQLKGSYRDYIVRCEEIDGRKVECWCNDGLDHVLIQPKFIQPHQYTGKYKWYAITGTVRRKYLTAKMTFCGKRHYYEEEVLVVPGLKRELIYSSAIHQRIQNADRSTWKNTHEMEVIKRRTPCGSRVRRNEPNEGKVILNKNKTPNCKIGSQRRFQQCRRSENPNWRKEIDDQTYMEDVDGERVNKTEYSHGTRNRKPYNVTLY